MFAIHCRDKASAAPLRAAHRPAHLQYVKGSGSTIIGAGPLINDDGHAVGGLFLINVADVAAARDWATNDPFWKLQIYETVEVHEWKYVFGTGIESTP